MDGRRLHYADNTILTRVRFLAVGYLYKIRIINMSKNFVLLSMFYLWCGCYTRPAVLVPYLCRLTCGHVLRTG